jgi:hypothetical protein
MANSKVDAHFLNDAGTEFVERTFSAKGWLFTVLRNIWLNELRRRRTLSEIVDRMGEGNLEQAAGDSMDSRIALSGESSCAPSITPYALPVDSSQPSNLGSSIRTQDLTRHSIWTLSAIGFLAYYITVMWHEIVGHGSMMYLFGVRSFVLTSTSISMDALILPARAQNGTVGGRLIAMNGAISNVILGVALYFVFRILTRNNAKLAWRVFFWLLAALNVFIGFIYPFYSGVFGVGDWSDAIVGLPHHALLRVLEVASGTILGAGTVVFFAKRFAGFPESLWRLSLVPFCSATVMFCLAGLGIPNGAELMVISVIPAALLGQSILVFVTPVARRLRSQTPPAEVIATSPAALIVGFVFVIVIFVTATGLHFAVR